jgi:hypothetical protein
MFRRKAICEAAARTVGDWRRKPREEWSAHDVAEAFVVAYSHQVRNPVPPDAMAPDAVRRVAAVFRNNAESSPWLEFWFEEHLGFEGVAGIVGLWCRTTGNLAEAIERQRSWAGNPLDVEEEGRELSTYQALVHAMGGDPGFLEHTLGLLPAGDLPEPIQVR